MGYIDLKNICIFHQTVKFWKHWFAYISMLSYFFSVFNLRVIENFSFYEVVVSSVNYNAPFFFNTQS